MKVLMFLAAITLAVGQQVPGLVCGGPGYKCCVQIGTCDGNPEHWDGDCCPDSKTCCSMRAGPEGQGNGAWDCCDPTLGQVCTSTGQGNFRCQATAAPPTAAMAPTAATMPPTPSSPDGICPFPDTAWSPLQECYTGWNDQGVCGAGSYCVAHEGTVNAGADGYCCTKNTACWYRHNCQSCIPNTPDDDKGCKWFEGNGYVGCGVACPAGATCYDGLVANTAYQNCPGIEMMNPYWTSRGSCFGRCDNQYSIGYLEYQRRVAAGEDVTGWAGTGYPTPLGMPNTMGGCSCDDDCENRAAPGADPNAAWAVPNDCCVDYHIQCHHPH